MPLKTQKGGEFVYDLKVKIESDYNVCRYGSLKRYMAFMNGKTDIFSHSLRLLLDLFPM